jgi:Glycosyl transferases group 1
VGCPLPPAPDAPSGAPSAAAVGAVLWGGRLVGSFDACHDVSIPLPPQRACKGRFDLPSLAESNGEHHPQTVPPPGVATLLGHDRVASTGGETEEFVIEAARRILSARPGQDIGFFHVGDGGSLPKWREAAAANGLGDRYRFVVHQTDLVPFYRAASLFVHASIRESFGLVIAEAMSCGLPVVATRSAGPQEIVADGETGFLVASDDIGGFTLAIQRYLDDPALREAHGRRGRERAISRFSLERQANEFAELLRDRFPQLRLTASPA